AGRRATGDGGRKPRTPNPDPHRPEEGAGPLPLTMSLPCRAEVLESFGCAGAFRFLERLEFTHERLSSCLRECPRIARGLQASALDLLCEEVRSFLAMHAPDPVSILHSFEVEFYGSQG
ncbi:MAG: hypothetical protein HY720_32355, partial [Planctomycetes bacterium]|nr:hypothetical protein [Planctomycetota bacterium]